MRGELLLWDNEDLIGGTAPPTPLSALKGFPLTSPFHPTATHAWSGGSMSLRRCRHHLDGEP